MSNILTYKGFKPKIHETCFVAKNAIISGDVEIEEGAGVWYNCVIRGDVSYVRIGKNTNVQDGTVIHVSRPNHAANKTGSAGGPTIIGRNVTIGHGAIIHACTIESESFIGMGCIIMDMAVVETGAFVAAGAVVPPNKVVKGGYIYAGSPAKPLRELTREEKAYIITSANNYYVLGQEYKEIDM